MGGFGTPTIASGLHTTLHGWWAEKGVIVRIGWKYEHANPEMAEFIRLGTRDKQIVKSLALESGFVICHHLPIK